MVPPYSDKVSRAPPYLFQTYFHSTVFAYGAITHYGQTFQTVLLTMKIKFAGWSAFARHYLRNLGWFLFLRLLRCFSSPGSLLCTYVFSTGWPKRAGFPHSDIYGSKLYCQLPVAFRRLTRLSSPVIAKASIICTYSLDPITLSPQPSLIKDATSICSSRVCDTTSIRLAWIWLDTIKTHLVFMQKQQ